MTENKLINLYLPYPECGERRVRVFVPAHEEGERLPVIYMTDGQNLFDEESCIWGCWHTREAVAEAMRNGDGGAVIVGIDHGGKRRDNELTPSSIGEVVHAEDMVNFTRAEGEIFAAFLMNTVKPAIESQFPVLIGRAHTAVCGSSSGGLESLFIALEYPESFSMAGVFSPATLLYSAESVRRWLLSKMTEQPPYLYFYTGCGDDLEQRIFASVEETYDTLVEIGYPGDCLNEIVVLEYAHHEKAWAEIFRDFLHTFLCLR